MVASLAQGVKILSNTGQEQGKGLEEPVAHAHQKLWSVLTPSPSFLYSKDCAAYVER